MTDQSAVNRERILKVLNGWAVLVSLIAILAADFALIVLYKVQELFLSFALQFWHAAYWHSKAFSACNQMRHAFSSYSGLIKAQ